ncbi:MAG: histidine kinase [Lysobacterales bacterium]
MDCKHDNWDNFSVQPMETTGNGSKTFEWPGWTRAMAERFYENRRQQFWALQLAGWGGFCVVTFFSLTLWYNTVEPSHILQILVQALLGMILSLPLYAACRHLWQQPGPRRMVLAVCALLLLALVWTVVRIAAFIYITSAQGNWIWADFGGWYFSSFLVYLCWVALYFGNKYYHRAQAEQEERLEAVSRVKEEQIRRIRAENEARVAQLGMLHYQLNPHFLFNTLNTVSALIRAEDNQTARRMITRLGHFLHHSLESDPAQMITLDEEIEALMLYLDIEKIRFGERLKLEIDIEERAGGAIVPGLLLQPLVENAVKHAIALNEAGGTIAIKARVDNGDLHIELTDTGPGGSVSEVPTRSGRRVGLQNTLQRLQTLYEESYVFDIEKRAQTGLRITIRIPFRESEAAT